MTRPIIGTLAPDKKVAFSGCPGSFRSGGGHPYPSSRLLRAHKLTFLDLKNSWNFGTAFLQSKQSIDFFFEPFELLKWLSSFQTLVYSSLMNPKNTIQKWRLSQASTRPENMTLSANLHVSSPQGWEVDGQTEAPFCDRGFFTNFAGGKPEGNGHDMNVAFFFYSKRSRNMKNEDNLRNTRI